VITVTEWVKYFVLVIINLYLLAEIELVGTVVGALRSAEIPGSIENPVAKSEVVIYPNPVVDVLNLSGVNDDVNVELYNSVGVKVKMEVGKAINDSDLKAGVYVARGTNDGKMVNKVIVKK